MRRLFNRERDWLVRGFASINALLLFVFVMTLSSCNKGNSSTSSGCVTEFMGIPVDGPKERFISALEKKGFEKVEGVDGDLMDGEFNAQRCGVLINTVKGVVSCVSVAPFNLSDRAMAQLGYNDLLEAFSNNPKYQLSSEDVVQRVSDRIRSVGLGTILDFAVFNQVGNCPDSIENRPVHLMLLRLDYGFYIWAIYYFNPYNMQNGEDL